MAKKKFIYDPLLGKIRKQDISDEQLEELLKLINGKSPVNHTHSLAQVSGLQDALGLKQDKIVNNQTIGKLVVTIDGTRYAIAREVIVAPNKPTITTGGTFTYSKAVSLTNLTSGATTYYTTDGSDPKTSNTRSSYSSAVTLPQDTGVETKTYTFRAISYKNGEWSEEATAQTFNIKRRVATPTFSSATGNKYSGTRTINFACATSDATIQYKIGDGAWTDGNSVTINSTSVITIRAYKANWETSTNSTATTYTLNAPKSYIGQAAAVTETSHITSLANAYEKDTLVGETVPTINFGTTTQYVWFAIPNTAAKTLIVKSEGFVVTLADAAGTVVGNWRVWRTANEINDSFTFEIN